MIRLRIDDSQREELREFLQHCLDSTTVEIHHTDSRAFRERVKQKEKLIQDLLHQLGAGTQQLAQRSQ